MSQISQIANQVACGGADAPNTGKLGCLSLFGTPTHMLAFQKGYEIPANTVFDLNYLIPLIQKGIVVPLIGASNFEDLSAEDTYSTNSRGVKRLNLKGLPEYKLTFEEGHEFYRNLSKMEGFKNYDYLIGDEDGNWILATLSTGAYKGLDAGHTTPELTKRKVPGGDAEMKSLVVQFLTRAQFDKNYAILHADELTFYPEEIPAVNGVELTFTSVPANLGTTLNIQAELSSDRHTLVEGLTHTEFYVTINGTPEVLTAPDVTEPTPGNYVITVSSMATNDVVVVDLYDGTLSADVVLVGSNLYRSEGATATVA